jgi:hypothetical protein
MDIQFFPDNDKVLLNDIDARKYRGTLPPGSKVQQANSEHGVFTIKQLKNSLFTISYRIFKLFNKVKLFITEGPSLRFEALLNGEMQIFYF